MSRKRQQDLDHLRPCGQAVYRLRLYPASSMSLNGFTEDVHGPHFCFRKTMLLVENGLEAS